MTFLLSVSMTRAGFSTIILWPESCSLDPIGDGGDIIPGVLISGCTWAGKVPSSVMIPKVELVWIGWVILWISVFSLSRWITGWISSTSSLRILSWMTGADSLRWTVPCWNCFWIGCWRFWDWRFWDWKFWDWRFWDWRLLESDENWPWLERFWPLEKDEGVIIGDWLRAGLIGASIGTVVVWTRVWAEVPRDWPPKPEST